MVNLQQLCNSMLPRSIVRFFFFFFFFFGISLFFFSISVFYLAAHFLTLFYFGDLEFILLTSPFDEVFSRAGIVNEPDPEKPNGITQILEKKEGVFRMHLMGKVKTLNQ
jgi:hypothetical protein